MGRCDVSIDENQKKSAIPTPYQSQQFRILQQCLGKVFQQGLHTEFI